MMKLDRRRQRKRQRADRKESAAAAPAAGSIHVLPDDLLRRILLRLDSPQWLIRAACACKRWRRAVTDGGRAFLRLASSLHPPTVAGQYHIYASFDNRFVPSSSSPAILDGGSSRFSIAGFLDDKGKHIADCHGGLVLLSVNEDLVVYDPLARKHRLISGHPSRNELRDLIREDVFLLDGDDDGHISLSNFKVLHLDRRISTGLTDDGPHQAWVFSRNNGGEWGWRLLNRRFSDKDLYPGCSVHAAGRVDGTLYIGFLRGTRMIAIDNTSLVFSMVDLPTGGRHVDDTSLLSRRPTSSFTVVQGTGSLGPTFSPERRTSIVHVCGEELEVFRQVQGSGEWVLEHKIASLSKATRGLSASLDLRITEGGIEWRAMVSVVADGAACAILSASSSYNHFKPLWFLEDRWFLSIDVNTMELRVLPEETYRQTMKIFNYTLPWPQFLRSCP